MLPKYTFDFNKFKALFVGYTCYCSINILKKYYFPVVWLVAC